MFWEFTVGDAIGTGLAVSGFGLTYWQLARTKRAADAARRAVVAQGRTVAVSDMSRILALLADAADASRAKRWPRAEALIEDSILLISATLARPGHYLDRAQLVKQRAALVDVSRGLRLSGTDVTEVVQVILAARVAFSGWLSALSYDGGREDAS